MKNLLVANHRSHGRVAEKELRTLVETQIENSLSVGWKPNDIVVVSNLNFDASVTLVRAPLNETCLTGSKMFALEYLFQLRMIKEPEMWWAHDLDAWQNYWFDEPAIADIGLTEYSAPKFNGGSIFLRASARDLVMAIASHIRERGIPREEPAIDRVLRMPIHAARVTVLNSTYNVGCSAYAVRYERSHQPILVSHFHPNGGPSWRTHVWGQNELKKPSVSPRLLELLVRRFKCEAARVPDTVHRLKAPFPRHYRLRESFHLGDCWARLNFALRLLEQGEEFCLYLPNRTTHEILRLLEVGSLRPKFLDKRPMADEESKKLFRRIDTGSAAYECTYFRTQITHKPHGRVIAYSLDAQWKVEEKIPPNVGNLVTALRTALPDWDFLPIGQPHQKSVTELVRALASVQLLLAVDNGVAHVARSVGVPLFLLEHRFPVSRGFPPERCVYTKVSALNLVEEIVRYSKGLNVLPAAKVQR